MTLVFSYIKYYYIFYALKRSRNYFHLDDDVYQSFPSKTWLQKCKNTFILFPAVGLKTMLRSDISSRSLALLIDLSNTSK